MVVHRHFKGLATSWLLRLISHCSGIVNILRLLLLVSALVNVMYPVCRWLLHNRFVSHLLNGLHVIFATVDWSGRLIKVMSRSRRLILAHVVRNYRQTKNRIRFRRWPQLQSLLLVRSKGCRNCNFQSWWPEATARYKVNNKATRKNLCKFSSITYSLCVTDSLLVQLRPIS